MRETLSFDERATVMVAVAHHIIIKMTLINIHRPVVQGQVVPCYLD